MIDFRYHLVSLVAVFLALSIGIVLGAGPLRENLGETLTSQVEQLRADRDQMRAENASLTEENSAVTRYTRESGLTLVEGTLPGDRVAVVIDSAALAEQAKEVQTLVQAAGGKPTTVITVLPAMWAPDKNEARTTALTLIKENAPKASVAGSSTSAQASAALADALSAHNDLTDKDRAEVLRALTDAGLIEATVPEVTGADAIAYLGAPDSTFADASDDATKARVRSENVQQSQDALMKTVRSRDVALAVASSSDTPGTAKGLAATVRGQRPVEGVASVDNVQRPSGSTVTVLTLAGARAGAPGNYGEAGDADALLPDVRAIRAEREKEKPRSNGSDGGKG